MGDKQSWDLCTKQMIQRIQLDSRQDDDVG